MNSVNIFISGSSKFISVAVPDGSIKLFGSSAKTACASSNRTSGTS